MALTYLEILCEIFIQWDIYISDIFVQPCVFIVLASSYSFHTTGFSPMNASCTEALHHRAVGCLGAAIWCPECAVLWRCLLGKNNFII